MKELFSDVIQQVMEAELDEQRHYVLCATHYECCSYQNLYLHILSETPILRAFLIISVYISVYENIAFDKNNVNITETKNTFLFFRI